MPTHTEIIEELCRGKEELRDALVDMVDQFAYEGYRVDGGPAIGTGGLSALEHAFRVLGYSDPHPVPEAACREEGCQEWATETLFPPMVPTFHRVCKAHAEQIGAAWVAKQSEADGAVSP